MFSSPNILAVGVHGLEEASSWGRWTKFHWACIGLPFATGEGEWRAEDCWLPVNLLSDCPSFPDPSLSGTFSMLQLANVHFSSQTETHVPALDWWHLCLRSQSFLACPMYLLDSKLKGASRPLLCANFIHWPSGNTSHLPLCPKTPHGWLFPLYSYGF